MHSAQQGRTGQNKQGPVGPIGIRSLDPVGTGSLCFRSGSRWPPLAPIESIHRCRRVGRVRLHEPESCHRQQHTAERDHWLLHPASRWTCRRSFSENRSSEAVKPSPTCVVSSLCDVPPAAASNATRATVVRGHRLGWIRLGYGEMTAEFRAPSDHLESLHFCRNQY